MPKYHSAIKIMFTQIVLIAAIKWFLYNTIKNVAGITSSVEARWGRGGWRQACKPSPTPATRSGAHRAGSHARLVASVLRLEKAGRTQARQGRQSRDGGGGLAGVSRRPADRVCVCLFRRERPRAIIMQK